MAKPKKDAQTAEVFGRALVDIPAVKLKCGDFATLPAEVAATLAEAGEFDPNAEESNG